VDDAADCSSSLKAEKQVKMKAKMKTEIQIRQHEAHQTDP
jgi:hypothetical protein